ncbi:MAG: HAD-IC family P-type ATPase [Azospirillaceae bacterium]|nr:HAD-IC family P-type ATPase [Azospirillaceae bacterium]
MNLLLSVLVRMRAQGRNLAHNPPLALAMLCALLTTLLIPTGAVSWRALLGLWLLLAIAKLAPAGATRHRRNRLVAKRLTSATAATPVLVPATRLHPGDLVLVEAGDLIPVDGEIIDGIATVDESAITGESACVLRESGGDTASVTAGTRVVSDHLIIEVAARPTMPPNRLLTPWERAIVRLSGIITLGAIATTAAVIGVALLHGVAPPPLVTLIVLPAALSPVIAGALIPALAVVALARLARGHLSARSRASIEMANEIKVLFLDKTGTVTVGNRCAVAFLPLPGIAERTLGEAAWMASIGDETPEGRSIRRLATERFGCDEEPRSADFTILPFSSRTRISGSDHRGEATRKGAVDAVLSHVDETDPSHVLTEAVQKIAKSGGTPLLVARGKQLLGLIRLEDQIKPDLRIRFDTLRQLGIRSVLLTGDNPLTAAAIAAEIGVDDFAAHATPQRKLDLIRAEQAKGSRVAMVGDGTDDAPALAQADIGLAVANAAPAAREAANMIGADGDPTRLIEAIEAGRRLVHGRRAVVAFSLAGIVTKAAVLLPPLFGLDGIVEARDVPQALATMVLFDSLGAVILAPLVRRGRTGPRIFAAVGLAWPAIALVLANLAHAAP